MDEVERLIRQLKDPDPEVREKAAKGLGDLRDPRAVPALIGAFNDNVYLVYSALIYALVDIGKDAVPALVVAQTKTPMDTIQMGAGHALVRLIRNGDTDLSQVRDILRELVERFGEENPGAQGFKRRLAKRYAALAAEVARRTPVKLPKDMLPARIRPPKKPGVYRTGRATNG